MPRVTTSIRTKLALLAGVPAVGALLLALVVANDARQRAASAASLGSIEDLARLTSYMAGLLHAVQDERAVSAVADGWLTAESPTKPDTQARTAARRATDMAAEHLEAFLATRDRSKFPVRLSRGLRDTDAVLHALPALRHRLDAGPVELQDLLAGFGSASSSLVSATAALSELTDDGAMLRSIDAVVALLELEERASIEDAVVGHAAARGEFAPGAFKSLVTTTTEEQLYDQAFRLSAPDDVRRSFEAARQEGRESSELLDSVLKSTEDTVSLDPARWQSTQQAAMGRLREVESLVLGRLEKAAASKAEELLWNFRLSIGTSFLIVLLSASMAIFFRRDIQASVASLSSAADKVRSSKDFSVRARRVSNDELGILTDTFNEMLTGIESREAELEQHRSHLEGLVSVRTRELAARNAAMRLVLDNVEQGLATVDRDGTLHEEASDAFRNRFGSTAKPRPFYEALSPQDERLALYLKLGWEQVADGFLPYDVSVEQLPKRFDLDGRHFTLSVKPILEGEELSGALLVVTDVTEELEARREQARQREEIEIFRRIARDKASFMAFLEETGGLVDRLQATGLGAHEQLSLVHTIKGNAAQYDVRSVSDVAHDLESTIADGHTSVGADELKGLLAAWKALVEQTTALLGASESSIELSRKELERILDRVSSGATATQVVTRLRMLFDEPVGVRLARLGEHAERLAARLGKPAPSITIQADDLRLPRGPYAGFWSALVHVVRNAVDHGIEDPAVRTAQGKPEHGTLTFHARLEDRTVVIEIVDDGAGVDWDTLAAKARAAGLPSTRREDVERAMFTAGVTSQRAVTDVSGRGVGLAAVWEATAKAGGTVRVSSTRGKETRFVFRLPLARETAVVKELGTAS
jgi:two-component system chemotaxis sensor kinase CheA